jgi:hypothetical protein
MLIFGDKPPVSAGGFYLLDCLLNLTPVGHCELATERRMVGRFSIMAGDNSKRLREWALGYSLLVPAGPDSTATEMSMRCPQSGGP